MSEEVVRESSGTLADCSVREVGRAILKELDMLRNRIAELEQAVGLMTALKPTMVMDADHPLDMAKEVAEYVTARIAELEAERKWIPASERLPERQAEGECTDDVLVFCDSGYTTAYYDYAEECWVNDFEEVVTHWMPLPQLPIVYGKVREE